jgi:hypothetical protein
MVGLSKGEERRIRLDAPFVVCVDSLRLLNIAALERT